MTFLCVQILIENGGTTGVEYVQDGEKRVAKLAVGGEVRARNRCVHRGRGARAARLANSYHRSTFAAYQADARLLGCYRPVVPGCCCTCCRKSRHDGTTTVRLP